MADQCDDEHGLRNWGIKSISLGIGLALYLLSFGPMFWICSDSRNQIVGPPGKAFVTFYAPIIWPYQNGPQPIRQAIGRYLELFEK